MKWNIPIDNIALGGLAPAYFKDTSGYPSYGNKNHAGAMANCDLTNPTFLTQGKGLTTITGTVDQLMKGILNNVMVANKSVGVGGTKLYEITASAVTAKTCGAITGGEDVALYAGELFYSWNTDIGKCSTAFASPDADWWTAVASGSALTTGLPHQMVVAGTSGVLFITNGHVIAQWNGTTATDDAFDTEDNDSVIVSIVWNQNRLWIAANKPNVAGRNEASVYVWDGNADSWESQVKINGKIGALYVKNGVTFVFYQKNLSEGIITLGHCNGSQIKDIANYYGSLPSYYQITDYEDFLVWASGTSVFAWGSGDTSINTRLFQLAGCGTGGLANPFGDPITASSTKLEKFSGYTVASSWKSLLFDITGTDRMGVIDKMRIKFEKLASNARVDWTLRNNKGTALKTGTISYAVDGAITSKTFNPKCRSENFRIEFDWSSGNVTNAVAMKSILISGYTIK